MPPSEGAHALVGRTERISPPSTGPERLTSAAAGEIGHPVLSFRTMTATQVPLGVGRRATTPSGVRRRGHAAARHVRAAKATDLLSSALASGAFAKLVGYFTVRPEDAPHVRALMRGTGLGARSLQLELTRLERLGLVKREATEDGRVRIRATARRAAWAPFRELVRAYADPVDLLRLALADVPGITAAFVFGAFARGTADDESDVDLFVLVEPMSDASAPTLDRVLAQRTVEASVAIGREVNPFVVTASQFAERLAAGRGFYENVIAGPKRWVIGTPKNLAKAQRTPKR
jgi:predicted nucleotidyltransferase